MKPQPTRCRGKTSINISIQNISKAKTKTVSMPSFTSMWGVQPPTPHKHIYQLHSCTNKKKRKKCDFLWKTIIRVLLLSIL